MNIRKIAELAECSPSTVSRVLSGHDTAIKISEKTREKIMDVCKRFDYQPSIHAARFFSKQSKTVGLLTPAAFGLEDENFAKFMSSVYFKLTAAAYRLLPLMCDENFISNKEYLSIFKRNEIDFLIIWGINEPQMFDELYKNKMPFILSAGRSPEYPSVTCDDSKGISELVAHCRKKGSEKFIFLSGLSKSDNCARRLDGFIKATQDCQAKILDPNGIEVINGKQAVNNILKYRPDAVICANDKLAVGVIQELQNRNINVPGEMLVTGADNIEISEYSGIPISTFDQMAGKCAEVCAETVLNHLKNDALLKSTVIRPKLCIRNSA